MIKDLLEQQSPGSMQSFFQENYISEMARGVQSPSGKARDMLEQIHKKVGIQDVTTSVISIKRRNYWSRIAVAASILIVVGISSYFLFTDQSAVQNRVVEIEKQSDIKAPETNRAMITLSDGRKIYLDSLGNGMLASQSGTNVIKTADGQIAYQIANGGILQETQYNTLTNPRGSNVIDMTLSDGSRVWLNAGSSVTYPVSFAGNERIVSISGEAYFEIVHNASKPFKVTKGDLEVAVLGTHFNVNAYEDESEIKVTLLEGLVKVSTNKQPNNSTILKPGQQSIITPNAIPTTLSNVDIDQVMAWKNGLFTLKGTRMEDLMRQVGRWYGVEVEYTGKVPVRKFGGTISRKVNLSTLLKALNEQGVNITLEDKKVIVGESN